MIVQHIYTITNTCNDKKYVGCGNINSRFSRHLYCLRNHKHTNKALQMDYDKYGENAFVFEAIKQGTFEDERKLMLQLQTYDERFGYNSDDPWMRKVRREHGLYVKQSPLKWQKRK